MISGRNHAKDKPATQSNTLGDHTAMKAVDGVITPTRENTNFALTVQGSNQWWKVDLEKDIIFQYARIFPRSGLHCDRNKTLCGKNTVCILLLDIVDVVIVILKPFFVAGFNNFSQRTVFGIFPFYLTKQLLHNEH